MQRLVPLVASGQAFVEEMRRAWEDGDAVLPVDPRLPEVARDRLLETMRLDEPVEAGDAVVVATSGTTGESQGVVLTHDALAASAAATSRRLKVDPAADKWLACLPLAHVGGLAVVVRALRSGTALEVHDGFDAAAVDRSEATLVSLVPTALRRIHADRFRRVVLGGSAPPSELPENVTTTYGLTESGSGCVYDGEPLDGVDVRIVDDEIQLRGPMLLRCYRDGVDPKDDEGWFGTDDMGALAGDRLVVHGRRGDLIVTGGENVWPEPVEARLTEHELVGEVAITAVADEEWGQIVVAHVVPADPFRIPRLPDMRAWIAEVMPVWCAPRKLVITDRLPRTPLGKIHRAALP